VNVDTESDLGKLRRSVGPLRHDDERLRDRIVSLLRDGSIISRVICATEAPAWDRLRICAGMRFRRENQAAYLASELAVFNEPMALAA
jgi:hypothetical protein